MQYSYSILESKQRKPTFKLFGKEPIFSNKVSKVTGTGNHNLIKRNEYSQLFMGVKKNFRNKIRIQDRAMKYFPYLDLNIDLRYDSK